MSGFVAGAPSLRRREAVSSLTKGDALAACPSASRRSRSASARLIGLVFSRLDGMIAYRFPEGTPDDEVQSPVNLMRMTLNRVLGLGLPMLTDRFFWASGDRPYEATELDPGKLLGSRR